MSQATEQKRCHLWKPLRKIRLLVGSKVPTSMTGRVAMSRQIVASSASDSVRAQCRSSKITSRGRRIFCRATSAGLRSVDPASLPVSGWWVGDRTRQQFTNIRDQRFQQRCFTVRDIDAQTQRSQKRNPFLIQRATIGDALSFSHPKSVNQRGVRSSDNRRDLPTPLSHRPRLLRHDAAGFHRAAFAARPVHHRVR